MQRYLRQIDLLGLEGQEKLSRSTALVCGIGGLGSPASLYLASSGIGKIILVDRDALELSNLNRQIIYSEEDIGKPKVELAAKRLKQLRSDIEVVPVKIDIFDEAFEELVKQSDVIIDGMDSWEARLRINELAVRYRKPFIHAAVGGWYGQLMVVIPGKSPCLYCVFRSARSQERPASIFPPVPGAMGALEAAEAIKILIGKESSAGKIIHVDLLRMEFKEIKVMRDPNCPICGGIKSA
ncbi:MAG: HesA/MoeB/ThiF family protein [Desulfurococcales archaeon]|uniref:HesA/MoeB/ThiF family protein n=1 Tax=Fervidicoccus fontis TaxID=683846 RepID=A0A7J3SMG4_9CREN